MTAIAARIGQLARRLAGMSLVGMVATGMLVALPAAPAEAFTFRNQGNPGVTQVPDTVGYCTYTCSSAGHFIVQFPERTVWRSSSYSSQTQVVTATFQLYRRYSGVWEPAGYRTASVTIPPGYSGRLPWREIAPNGRYVAVDVTLVWRTLGGTFIGSTYIDYSAMADYTAYSPIRVAWDNQVGGYLSWGF